MKSFLFCASLILVTAAAVSQDELEISKEEFPRIPATEPADALDTFEVEPGFELALAASEPEVMDPIAMTFDEKGRAYVIEMRGYSEHREDALGRIRLLTDDDGDGVFDRSTVFKDGLKWPTAIICYDDGVFVGATPDVYYFRDTDGDGVADEERTVFTGFGEGRPELNMQALFNSFRWGPDNRIWGATAGNGGVVSRPDDSGFEPLNLRGADFSFDPEKLDLRAESGTAQYGMSFDSQGRRFVCANSRHLVWVAYERDHVEPNPWFSLPAPLVDIPDDGAAAPVYRISPDEPWRIVRTRWRVAGVVKGVVEGGGRVSGYFTAATGVHAYWGDAFPPDYRDNAFIGDAGSNLVHRKEIKAKNGSAELVATRPDPDEKTEFLRSRDNWFRPTSFVTGPDGCLYVTDMYREVIEHPWSLPEPIKKHLDLNSGNDRGRIYRVAPSGFEPPTIPDLGSFGDDELEALLDHANDWHRTTARRLLYERGKPADPAPPVAPFPAALSSELALFDFLEEAADDRWMRAAVLNSLRTTDDLAEAWTRSRALSSGALGSELAAMVGRTGDTPLIEHIAGDLAGEDVSAELVEQIEALRTGMGRSKSDWKTFAASTRWSPLTEQAAAILPDADQPVPKAVAAARVLAIFPESGKGELLKQTLLAPDVAPPVAEAIVSAIYDFDFLIDRFAQLPGASKSEVANRILANAPASRKFLEAIDSGKLTVSDAPASLVDGLRQHKNEEVKSLAEEALPPVVSRADVLENYEDALTIEGDRERGRAAFAKACIACHLSHEEEGIALGPPVTTFASAGKDSLLANILDPNREVAPQFQPYTFEFHNEPPVTGIILSENASEVTVRMPGGIDRTFPRSEVASMAGLGQSLMPEGLENTLSVQEMADLLAYIAAP
ncbi:MAG: PVC-type heme-binding CxxCH protein [Verrucomicrobiales bacterium]